MLPALGGLLMSFWEVFVLVKHNVLASKAEKLVATFWVVCILAIPSALKNVSLWKVSYLGTAYLCGCKHTPVSDLRWWVHLFTAHVAEVRTPSWGGTVLWTAISWVCGALLPGWPCGNAVCSGWGRVCPDHSHQTVPLAVPRSSRSPLRRPAKTMRANCKLSGFLALRRGPGGLFLAAFTREQSDGAFQVSLLFPWARRLRRRSASWQSSMAWCGASCAVGRLLRRWRRSAGPSS